MSTQVPLVFSVSVRGTELRYIRFGSGGKALVVVAGMNLTDITLQADAIAAAFAPAAKDYTVYVFSCRTEPPFGFTVRDMAEDLAAAMQTLGIRDADLMGNSMGGMIVQCLAMDHPALVHAAVLSSTLCRPNPTSEETFALWRDTALRGDPAAVNDVSFRRIYTEKNRADNAAVFAALLPLGTARECARFAVMAEACRRFDRAAELGKIRCPVLVVGVWGDMVLSGKASVELAERLGCELRMYEGYGHCVCDEAPDFQRQMLDFFRKSR